MKEQPPKEIASFNRELMNFDVGDLSVEELDRRLELAIANVAMSSFGCLTDCGQNCGSFSCNANCGANTKAPKPVQD